MWERKEILICVKTYPEYSSKYTETVCTAGILADTKRLIRLYPVPFRYLGGDQRFKKYQWISAEICKNVNDSRPESYMVKEGSISLGKVVSSGNRWQYRKEWVLSEGNLFRSLERLQYERQEKGTSLGLIKPKKIFDVKITEKTPEERAKGEEKKSSIMNQLNMLSDKKNLELLPIRLTLGFACDDRDCRGHEISILDWEMAELYRKHCSRPDCEERIREKVINDIFGPDRDTYLIMGNMASRRNVFCILGFFWPPRLSILPLFESN